MCSRGMNDILAGRGNKQYGILSSLGNTWLSAYRLELEIKEIKQLQKDVEELKKETAGRGR